MTTLPDLPKTTAEAPPAPKWPLSASMPGPVFIPGVSLRNPITGRGYVYSSYAWSQDHPRITPHHIKEHERSIFTNTNFNSSFYVVSPEWSSEATSLRRIIAKERDYYSWDTRPAVQPMRTNPPKDLTITASRPLRETARDTYLPYLQLRARKEQMAPSRFYRKALSTMERYGQYGDVWKKTKAE